jgi:hypothetical protein
LLMGDGYDVESVASFVGSRRVRRPYAGRVMREAPPRTTARGESALEASMSSPRRKPTGADSTDDHVSAVRSRRTAYVAAGASGQRRGLDVTERCARATERRPGARTFSGPLATRSRPLRCSFRTRGINLWSLSLRQIRVWMFRAGAGDHARTPVPNGSPEGRDAQIWAMAVLVRVVAARPW